MRATTAAGSAGAPSRRRSSRSSPKRPVVADGVEHAVGVEDDGVALAAGACPSWSSSASSKTPAIGPGAPSSRTAPSRMRSGSGWPAESEASTRSPPVRAVQPDHRERASAMLGLLGQRAVDRGDRASSWTAGVLGDGPQRVAHEPGQRRRARALARDVADADGPARGGREGVVEVAADVVELARRAVERRGPQPGHRRQLRRAQALLQLPRDLGALLRQAGVEHGDRGAAAELLGQPAVLVGERARPAERQRPELAAAGAQRDDEPRVARGRLAPGARGRRPVDVEDAPVRQLRHDDRRDVARGPARGPAPPTAPASPRRGSAGAPLRP